MKREMSLTLSLLMVAAVPLLAGEPKKTEKKTASTAQAKSTESEAAPATTPETETTIVSAEPSAEDSPIVAAAKRANRPGKKAKIVITNENLAEHGKNARITTAETPAAALPAPGPPPAPTPEMVAHAKAAEQKKKADEESAKQKADAEKRQRALAKRASEAEEGLYDLEEDDPAVLEKDHSDAAARAAENPPEH